MEKTILVVDDSAYFRSMLSMSLQESGFQVRDFEDGQKLVDDMHQSGLNADLILLDLLMPGLSGHDTLKAIRDSNRKIPVIIMISEQHRKYAIQCANYGISGVLTKPLDPDLLLVRIREILEIEEDSEVAPVHRYKVLILEKNYQFASLMKHGLEKKYFHVRIGSFFDDLNKLFEEFQPDLVLTCQSCPANVKPTELKKFKKQHEFKLVTYRTLPPNIMRRKRVLQQSDYQLPNPFNMDELIHELYTLCSG